MFYFLISSALTYNLFLIAAAVVPAVLLMFRVYRSDRLEKESPAILWSLTKAGIFSALIALVAEWVLGLLLRLTVSQSSDLYQVILYFVVVAVSEEGAKYFLLQRRSWNSPEFNCQYDGVVYAVFVALGFALWENISYVLHYGLHAAVVRAVTAIPGHACFGVFMGVFYGLAKRCERRGEAERSKQFRILAVAVPVLLHGAYDFIATMNSSTWLFVAFVAVLFVVSYVLVGKMSKRDQFI